MELKNKLVPIGADYVHGYEYDASRDGSNTPTVVGASNKSAAPIKSSVIYSPAPASLDPIPLLLLPTFQRFANVFTHRLKTHIVTTFSTRTQNYLRVAIKIPNALSLKTNSWRCLWQTLRNELNKIIYYFSDFNDFKATSIRILVIHGINEHHGTCLHRTRYFSGTKTCANMCFMWHDVVSQVNAVQLINMICYRSGVINRFINQPSGYLPS